MCSINYPPDDRFDQCPVCGQDTFTTYVAEPDTDWLDMAESKVVDIDGPIPETLPEYRPE